MKSSVSSEGIPKSEKVFISRQGAERRKIANYDKVSRYLRSIGFDICKLEKLSLKEQILLFSQADIVMGIHGAGFANIMYSDNSTIVEIFPEGGVRTCYYILANEMGLNYDCYIADPEKKSTESGKNSDIMMNLDNFRSWINQYSRL
jgi:capsular polysaccharide biosynthesis protein